jgi:hypothetical protein
MRCVLACSSIAVLWSSFVNSQDTSAVTPPCRNPARLIKHDESAPGYFVGFGGGTTDIPTRSAALAKKYHFDYQQYTWGLFIASISQDTIAKLRCVPEVEFIESNAIAHLTDTVAPVAIRFERSRVASTLGAT